ncbi:hypothetical protein HYDPIDRAFT_170487 [Hydnomerulius pinastri MD-312]|uniref:Uncharacterized protein n=1 Tax=Hydnomerulius pinastri MD-312 TaxID=994086 RepID=A0A0C9WA10_9AGAM|nr:hypothetical protein HYDPIDRAFT_170487 [Hydnomerulius pinastri MD-312]
MYRHARSELQFSMPLAREGVPSAEALFLCILDIDPHAEFDDDDCRVVRHSQCGRRVTVKEPYDVTRFRQHNAQCSSHKPSPAGGTPTISQWARTFNIKLKKPGGDIPSGGQQSTTSRPHVPLPCPGLREVDEPLIRQYLTRTGVSGGGSRSVAKIAETLFKKTFSKLSGRRRRAVLDQQVHEQAWRNDHQRLTISASKCDKFAILLDGCPQPCSQCRSLLDLHAFRKAIKKPIPSDENYVHVNHHFRPEILGKIYARTVGVREIIETASEERTPCIQFATGVLQGKFKDLAVFTDLVEVMVSKLDREERGVGMQNFKYAPAWDEFVHIVKIHSPAAHRFLKKHLPARTERSFRVKESRRPQFPMTICSRSFELVANHLAALSYNGPVSVCCDDTKLHPVWRLFWDRERKGHYLVGGVSEPLLVTDPESIREIVDNAEQYPLATKLRLWCMQIPLPKMAPIVIAMLPISSDNDADTLTKWSLDILRGLREHQIMVVSYACDGTEVERAVQRNIAAKSEETIKYMIKSPCEGFDAIELEITKLFAQALAELQDSKHGLKTFRNNLFSGARLLTLGNYTAIFARIRTIAFETNSPLYHRDVEKLDRQDDNAAARLFSSQVLGFIVHNHPDYVGEIVYLFVHGELIDAYQNRSISHRERLKMALRTYYVHQGWRNEPGEHLFSGIRELVKDFAALEAFYSVPPLHVKQQEAVLSQQSPDFKARAQGYCHTYFYADGVDLQELSRFPTDLEIEEAAQEAAGEAQSLIAVLGVNPSHLTQPHTVVLPGINRFVNLPPTASTGVPEESDSDSESHLEHEESDSDITLDSEGEPEESEAQQLESLISVAERNESLSRAQEEDQLRLTFASIAVAADEMQQVQRFAASADEEATEEMIAQAYQNIQDCLSLPPLKLADSSVDFNMLVKIREAHETRQAKKGCRTRGDDQADSSEKQDASKRLELIREFHAILKEQQGRGAGTGLERAARWTGSSAQSSSGNAANAATVAKQGVRKAMTRRKQIFTLAKLPFLAVLADARISMLKPLESGHYGLIFTSGRLRIGKVIALYSKGGGKNGKHGAALKADHIAALSYVGVQVYQQYFRQTFRAVTDETAKFQTHQFAFLPSIMFLCTLNSTPEITHSGSELTVSVADLALFEALKRAENNISEAGKLFRKRGKGKAPEEDELED